MKLQEWLDPGNHKVSSKFGLLSLSLSFGFGSQPDFLYLIPRRSELITTSLSLYQQV